MQKKNKIGPFFHTISKIQLQMYWRFRPKAPQRSCKENTHDISLGDGFFLLQMFLSQIQKAITKTDVTNIFLTASLSNQTLIGKWNNTKLHHFFTENVKQQSEDAVDGTGENTCKLSSW